MIFETRIATLEKKVCCLESQLKNDAIALPGLVVTRVLAQLPTLLSPMVEKCLGPALELSLAQALPEVVDKLVDKAMKKVKAENGAGCDPPSGEKCKAELPAGVAPRVAAPVEAPPTLPEGDFNEGESVLLHGLTKSSELNGQSGLVLGFDCQARRYKVKLVTDVLGTLSDKTVQIKASNLASADEVDFLADEADDMFSEEAVKADPYKVSESFCKLHRRSSGALSAQRAAALDMNFPDQ